MQFHTLKGRKVRISVERMCVIIPGQPCPVLPYVCAQNRIGGRLQPIHCLLHAPAGMNIEQVLAQLETFECVAGERYAGTLGKEKVWFEFVIEDGSFLIKSNLEA